MKNLLSIFLFTLCYTLTKFKIESFLQPCYVRKNYNQKFSSYKLSHGLESNYKTLNLISRKASNLDDEATDDEGKSLASEFFQIAKGRGIGLSTSEYDDEDDDEDDDDEDEITRSEEDDEDDETVREIPISEVNAFKGIDEGKVGKLAGNVTFSNKELYNSLKERVLESPASFATLVGNEESELDSFSDSSISYTPPSTTSPDSELSAGEVVTLIMQALLNNDLPSTNFGVKLLFSYSSPSSILKNPGKAPSVEEYADFLKSSEYKVLLTHDSPILIEKADYSYDRKKAFFTVRLKTGTSRRDYTTVNFILSSHAVKNGISAITGEDVWLIDSLLIRPEGLRRK